MEGLGLEDEYAHYGEDRQGDDFLNHFQLDEAIGAAVAGEADAVGGYHEAVFKQRDAPGQQDDERKGPVVDEVHLLEFEIAVPGKGHEDIGYYKQKNR